MQSIENKATFYVPVDKDAGGMAMEIARKGAELFGGATLVPATGLWTGLGEVVQDSLNLVIVFAPQTKRKEFTDFVNNSVRDIGVTLNQEEVAVEINGFLGLYGKDNGYV